MAVLHLTKENFDASIAEGKVIVDFWATWCGPCRMQAPILEQFDVQMGGNVKVCKVSTSSLSLQSASAYSASPLSLPSITELRPKSVSAYRQQSSLRRCSDKKVLQFSMHLYIIQVH